MPRPKGPGANSRADLPFLRGLVAAVTFCGFFVPQAVLSSTVQAETVNRSDKASAGCTTIDFLASDVAHKFPGKQTERLEGSHAASFMAAYNQLPPVSNFIATELLILFHEEFKITRIAFFRNGCAVAMATVPVPLVRALLRKTQGASI